MAKSCLKCKKWVTCRDPRKDINYSCNLYDEHRRVNSLDEIFELDLVPQGMINPDIKLMKKADEFGLGHINELLSENKKNLEHKPIVIQSQEQDLESIIEQKKKAPPPPEEVRLKMDKLGNDNELSNFIYQSMEDAYDPATNSIRDSRVDDRDLRLADNYYDYCTSLAGKTIKPPFARQLWVANHLLGEFCPRCTDKKYNSIHEVPVDMDPRDVYKRMQPLRGGVCPKCSATKSELIVSGELKDYIDLILILGQRSSKCKVGREQVQTNFHGLTTFKDLFNSYSHLFDTKSQKEQTVFNGFEGLKIATRKGMKPVGALYTKVVENDTIELTLKRSASLTGTTVHPMAVLCADTGEIKWKKLRDIRVGDAVLGSTGCAWQGNTLKLNSADLDPYKDYDSVVYPKVLTEKLALFLGILIADGNLTKNHLTISKSNKNQSHKRLIKQLLLELFNLDLNFKDRSDARNSSRIDISNKNFVSWMEQACGLKAITSAGKTVPTCIKKAPLPMVKAFLKGYLMCDSTFDTKDMILTSASKVLMDEMQTLIGACIGTLRSSRRRAAESYARNSPNPTVKEYYSFAISRKYVNDFIEEINLKEYKKFKPGNVTDSQERLPIVMANMFHEFLLNFTRVGSVDHDDTIFYEKNGQRHYISVSDIRSSWTKNRSLERERRRHGKESREDCQLRGFEDVNLDLVKELHPKLYTAIKIALDNKYFFSEVEAVTPKTGKVRVYDIEVPDGHEYIANNLVSHNTSFSSTIATYVFHRFLKAPRLSDICRGIQEFSPLTATFVGLTASRAIKLSWNPFSVIVENSEWFNSYFEMLRFQGRKYDREFYKRAGLFIRVFHKNLDLYPSAPMKRALRGDSRFYASCDEISWWPFKTIQSDDEDEDDERERANADEVYSALNNSLSTVRAEVLTLYKRGINTVPQALGMYLSSPVSEKDMGCRLQRAAMEEGSKSLGLRLPTWEMNPLYSRQHPIIVDAYRKNTAKAERDFGANPPALTNTVFDKTAIQGCFKRYSNNWRVAYLEHDTYTVAKIIEIVKAETLQPSVLAFDAGLTNNAFSLCVAHKEGSRMVCTLVIEVVPKAGKQISYPAIYENVVKPLGQALNILSVGADRWNSINLLQQAEIDIPGCKSMQKSLQYKDLTACVTSISSGDVDFPHLELDLERVSLVVDYKRELLNMPVSHLALQLLTIKDSGVAYMKGDNYTDDIFRAVAMAHWMLFGGRLKERLRKAKVKRGDGKGDVGTGTSIVVAGRSGLITRSISNNVKGGKKGKYDI